MNVGEAIAMTGLAHLVGDYLIQSHWMANAKTKNMWVAYLHGFTYSLPFWLITQSWVAIAVIAVSHAIIDHWRLARYVVWFRNQLAPRAWRPAFDEPTGSPADAPIWLSTWLLFIADNIIHALINLGAVLWL